MRRIHHANYVGGGGITRPVRETIRGGFARIDGAVLHAWIVERTVGHGAIAVLDAGVQIAAVRPSDALVDRGGQVAAVLALAEPFNVGVELTGLHGGASGTRALEDDIDDAGDGIGAVLCGGAVAKDLDAVDHRGRNGVEVHRRRAAADGAVVVDKGARVAPLAVHQHKCLVGGQAAQGGRPYMVRTIRDGWARKVQRWSRCLQHLGGLDSTGGT